MDDSTFNNCDHNTTSKHKKTTNGLEAHSLTVEGMAAES